MPLTIYQHFIVLGVVALCENGLPIPPDSLTEIAAVTHETTTDDDPNVSAWGIYGVLPDNSIDRLLAIHCLEQAERTGPLVRISSISSVARSS